MAASAYFDTVQKLYIAFYQRPADSAGLTYWAEQIDAANGNIEAAIQAFSTQEEALELYGEINEDTIGDVIDQIYFAAFGRYAEQEELDYWVPDFIAGNTTPSNIVLAVLLGAQGTDAASVNNKLEVANEFTTQVDGRPLTDPAFGTAPFAATYDGYDDVAAARDLLSGVTDDPASILSPEDVTTAIVDTIADEGDAIIPVEPPPTFSLTADADSVDEGDTVTFTVEGGKANFTYNYELTGVDATDVEGGVLTGSVTTDADGNGTFEVTLAADRATDGADTLTATLPNTGLSASVTVNDTSLDNIAPVAVDATANAIEEGAVVTGQLEATDADDDALTFTLDAPLQGLTLNADGSYSFDPTQNDIVKALTTAGGSTDLVATYTVTDALGATDTGTLTITAAPAPLSFKLEAGATTVNEDGSITFTVTANEAVAAATDVVFTLVPGNSTAVDQGTATTNLNDFDQGAFNPVTKQIAAGGTSVTFTITAPNDNVTELAESFSVQAVVGGQTLTATATLLDGSTGAGKTYMLTKGLDNVPGTAGNDTIIGSIDAAGGNAELMTLSTLDIVNGGAGTDTLKIASSLTAATTLDLPNLTGVEIIEVEATAGVKINTSAVAGLTNLNITKQGAGLVDATAAATTDIAVTVKEDDAGVAAALANVIKGGKNVTVTATDLGGATTGGFPDTIAVGGAGALAAAGDVVVNATGAKSVAGAAGDKTLSAITVEGGKTISVTQKATSDAAAAAADTVGATITQGAVTATGNAATTTVTVKQDASVAEVLAVTAVVAKAATQDVSFAAMTAGQTAAVTFGAGTLTFTATKALTAAEAASAFANLVANAKQGNASASLGIYTDATGGVTSGWASGAVTTVSATEAKVTFTSATAATAITTGGTAAPTAGAYSGNAVAAAAAKAGVLGVTNGVVTILDSAATGTIKTITVDGYGATSRIGAGNVGAEVTDTTSLETLNLSNSGLTYSAVVGKVGQVTGAVDITVDDTAATLALNLEKVGFSGYYNGEATTTTQAGAVTLTLAPTTLNAKSTGNNYVNLTAALTETLNVSGTGLLDASTTDLAALKTVKVTETAGLKLNDAVKDTVTSVDTTGTTGAVTVSITGNLATYAGGAGVDNVKVADAAITKAINLGAGDDRLDLTAVSKANLEGIVATNVLQGGIGTDTLVLSAANADSTTGVSGAATFEARVDGFEKLEVGQLAAAATVNLVNVDDINYVISNGAAAGAAPAAPVGVATAGGAAAEFTTFTFGAGLAAGQSFTIDGVTVTASAAVAAADVAGFFRALSTPVAGLTSTGSYGTPAAWTGTPVVSGATNTLILTNTVVGDVTDFTTSSSAGTPAAFLLTLDKMLTGATVELKAAGSVEVKLGTDGAADVVNFVANAATGTTLGTATAHKVETINIEAKDTDVTTAVAASGAVTANVSTNTLALNADAAKTVNLTGAGNLTLTLSADSKAVTLIDGSTATGKLTVTTLANDTAATTVKGGLLADVLTAAGANDVLQGGAGNDTLKVTTGTAVTLTGGDGIDAFDVSGFVGTAGGAATITDFTKGETIKFVSNAAADFVSSKVALVAGSTLTEYVAAAAKAASANSTVTHGVAWFELSGNTYIVQNIGADAAFNENVDIMVMLTGSVDLSASSFNDVGQGTLLFI